MIPGPPPASVLERLFAEWQSEIHTAFPAVVLAYDADAQTVEVRPCVKREVPAHDTDAIWEYDTLPDLVNVPVMWPGTSFGALTFPIVPGDGVLIVCGESATGFWRQGDAVPAEPAFVDPHGLNGCVALPGWRVDARRLSGVSTTDLVLGNAQTNLKVKADGTVTVGSDVAAVALALATVVDANLRRLQAAFDAHVHVAAGSPTAPPTTVPGVIPVGALASVAAQKARGV